MYHLVYDTNYCSFTVLNFTLKTWLKWQYLDDWRYEGANFDRYKHDSCSSTNIQQWLKGANDCFLVQNYDKAPTHHQLLSAITNIKTSFPEYFI